MRDLYGDVTLVDSGNAASSRELLDAIYQSMARMGYDAVGTGIMETALGEIAAESAKSAGIPLLGSVGLEGGHATPGTVVTTCGAHSVAVVSIGWTPDPADASFVAAVREQLAAARGQADFVVLLSQLGREDDIALLASEGLEGLADVAVGGKLTWLGGTPEWVGSTLLLPAGQKGRDLGVLEVKLAENGVRYYHQLIHLAPELPEDEEIVKLVDEYYTARLVRPMGALIGTTANQPPLPPIFAEDEARVIRGRGYLTAPECGRCHEDEHEQWQGTQHARALATLIDANRTVRECLSCHSEANRRGMPYNPEGADAHGVDCSACHGAGLFHASTGGAQDTIVRSPGEMVCRRCHTPARDLGFSMDVRLPGVTH